MITLDTSAILALANADDRHHIKARTYFSDDRGPYLVPAGILAEVAYMFDARVSGPAVDLFLRSLSDGALSFDCGESDFERIAELVSRYSNLSLGLADASVVACAERNGGRVLTFDRRDFEVIAGDKRIQVVGA
ncbi:MAG: PIN domain-containing protein [Dehalococcoidia bacterium]|nr:PIN domain-containing protein [Dehalococcoidia bacterium]